MKFSLNKGIVSVTASVSGRADRQDFFVNQNNCQQTRPVPQGEALSAAHNVGQFYHLFFDAMAMSDEIRGALARAFYHRRIIRGTAIDLAYLPDGTNPDRNR